MRGDAPLWFVIQSDGDIDYTDIYGPYDSEEEAEAALLEDDGSYAYRVISPRDPATLGNEG